MSADNLLARAGKAAAYSASAKWLDVICGSLTLLVTAHLLPPEAFGIFGMALLATLLPETVLSGALSESLIQRTDLRPGHLSGTFVLHLVLCGVFALGLVLMTPLVAAHFKQPLLLAIVPVLSASLVFGAIGSVPGAILMRELRFGAVALSDAASALTAAVVGIGMAFAGFGVWSLLWMECARRAVKAVVLVIGARWRPTLRIERADVLDLMHFNATTLGVRLLTQIDSAVPKFLVGMLLGAQALGYLNIAYRVFQQLSSLVLAPFNAVVLPVASAVQRDRAQLHRILGATTRVATMFAFPIFIGAAAVAPILFPLLLGPKWTPAILPAQILLITALKSPAASFNGGVLRGSGKPGLHLGIMAFGLVLTLILTPLAAPYGIAAVCVAVMLRGMIQWGVGAQLVERAVGYPAMQQFVVGWESFVASAAMGAVILALQQTALMHMNAPALLCSLIAIGIVVYVGLLSILSPKLVGTMLSLTGALVKRDRVAVRDLLRAS